jgi:hypothetical protein
MVLTVVVGGRFNGILTDKEMIFCKCIHEVRERRRL